METTLFRDDCLDRMKEIADDSVDMVLADLPYGVTSRNKWDSVIPFELLWEQYRRVAKENAAIVLHCQQPFTSALIGSNMADFKYCLYWFKHQVTGFLNAKKQPLRVIEEIAVFYRKQPTYNPQMRKGKRQMKNTGGDSFNYCKFHAQPHISEDYYPTQLLDFPLRRFKSGHPVQKPVPLLEYLIRTYTNPGETVLDNVMGSGSCGVACVNTGRNFIGIELDPGYFKIAQERIQAAQEAAKCI